jgi:hypothetical protein
LPATLVIFLREDIEASMIVDVLLHTSIGSGAGITSRTYSSAWARLC